MNPFPHYNFKFERPNIKGIHFSTVFNVVLDEIEKGNRKSLPCSVFWENERVIVLYDAYPKSKYHLLVLPKERKKTLKSVSHLSSSDIDTIQYMNEIGTRLIDHLVDQESRLQKKNSTRPQSISKDDFQMGFHSIPSIHVVHLHVMSTDFNTPQMKRKDHWNSFTTSFFVKPSIILKQLSENGKIIVDPNAEQIKKQALTFNKKTYPNIPDLKRYLKQVSKFTPGYN